MFQPVFFIIFPRLSSAELLRNIAATPKLCAVNLVMSTPCVLNYRLYPWNSAHLASVSLPIGLCNVFRTQQILFQTFCYTYPQFFIRKSSIRNLYSTFYPITSEMQQAVVLITTENKIKIKKLSVLRLDLSFLEQSV